MARSVRNCMVVSPLFSDKSICFSICENRGAIHLWKFSEKNSCFFELDVVL